MSLGLRPPDPPKVLVAGVGNVFLGDDGFGVEVARRLATGRASGVSWIGERVVVNPIAPARMASRSSRSIARRSSSLAACSNARSPITWVRSAQWPR